MKIRSAIMISGALALMLVSGCVTVMVPDIASAYQSRMKTADLSTGEEVAIFTRLEEDLKAAGVDFSNDFVETEVTMEEPTLEDAYLYLISREAVQ